MKANSVPEKITMDKSGANKAAMGKINVRRGMPIIVEQDHRAIKRVTKPMRNFKSFCVAKCVLASIELIHMIRKDRLLLEGGIEQSFTGQFYALVGKIRPV